MLRAASLSCGRSGRRRTDWILRSLTPKPSSSCTVSDPPLPSSPSCRCDHSPSDAFFCSDTNEDDVLDEQELEALFTKEVRAQQHVFNTNLLLGLFSL